MGITGNRSTAWPPRRWRSAAGIVLVLGLTVVGCYVEANPAHHYGGLHLAGHPPLAAYLLVVLPALALIWRDRAPVAVLAVSIGAAVAWAALGQIDGAALVPVMVALYWVALSRPRQVALAAGLAGAAVIFLAEGTLGPFGWLGGPNATMWPQFLAAGALGGYVGARRKWLAAERDSAAQAELMREEETRRRVDAERMRIARELHDVVAHSMAMINVQATAASVLLAEDPAGAADAIQAIRGASKSGLRELRAILQVLRVASPDGTAAPTSDLRDIQALADATTAAGTPTTVRNDARAVPLPPPVARAAYRIVQESLTNVIRHARGATATVTARQDAGDLLVEISNDGAAGATAFGDGAGAGLTGMRERAAALGGSLEAGPRQEGGFLVRARIPLTPPPAGTPPADLPPAARRPDSAAGLAARPLAGPP